MTRFLLLSLVSLSLAGCDFQADGVGLDARKVQTVMRVVRAARVMRVSMPDLTQFSAADHINLGVVLERKGLLLAALAQYEMAAAKAPGLAAARVNVGNVLRRLGQWQAALMAYRAALQTEPANFEAANNFADVCAERGVNTAEACDVIENALQRNSAQRAYGLETLGWLMSQRGRQERAIALLRQAVAEGPADVEFQALAHLHLGLALHRNGDTGGAVAMLDKALAMRPQPDLADRISFMRQLVLARKAPLAGGR